MRCLAELKVEESKASSYQKSQKHKAEWKGNLSSKKREKSKNGRYSRQATVTA